MLRAIATLCLWPPLRGPAKAANELLQTPNGAQSYLVATLGPFS
jgi:hypothetical protein